MIISDGARAQDWKPGPAPIATKWISEVSADHPLPEYPRPQMTRSEWFNLNGLWDYALTDATDAGRPAAYTGKILVPFPYESSLSGISGQSIPKQRLWYHRTFILPGGWTGQHVLLHFGAVNWESTVLVNNKEIGSHRGGYTGFDFDITDALKPGVNDLVVSAQNPLRVDVADAQVIGKQREKAESIFYTSSTGIWQTVWLEPVPVSHIVGLKLVPDVDAGVLHVTVETGEKAQVEITVNDGATVVAQIKGDAGKTVDVPIANPHLWSPTDPHLYDLNVSLMQSGKMVDSVGSYFGMRKISLGKDEKGRTRIFLNNKFLLEIGLLDQGFWPEGIYTAPTDDALKYDMETVKKMNFNLIRKHAKVEPPRWYYWADKLGLLVWQDMPQAFGAAPDGTTLSEVAKEEWLSEWQAEIDELFNFPSIIVWTTFNEGWGQHDTEAIVAFTQKIDPTRLVNAASGWVDKKVGDIKDTHAYPGPWSGTPEVNRAAVNGEFGGVTRSIPEHRWTTDTFGYGTVLQKEWLATKRYEGLLRTAYKLSDERGTSAFVYTQMTDVEEEINGLMTYDRKVIKLNPDVVATANLGQFPPLPPDPDPDLVPNSEDEPTDWNITTNPPAEGWQAPGFDDSQWKKKPAPFGHGIGGVRTDWRTPDIWIRRKFILPATIPDKLVFTIEHDEDVDIYLNGIQAAKAAGYVDTYITLPVNEAGRNALHAGENTLAAHVHQTTGGQVIDIGIIKMP
jgi:hypothetical protein